MELNENDFKSKIGRRMYELIMKRKETEKALPDNIVLEPLYEEKAEQPKSAGKRVKKYSILGDASKAEPAQSEAKQGAPVQETKPAAEPAQKGKELSDIVQKSIAEKPEQPEQASAAGYAQPKQDAEQALKKPAEERVPTRREALQMCEQLGVIGEKQTLLKLISNICIKKSTLIEGASNAGKSWVLDHVFELVPDSMKCKTNDSRNFFDLAKRYNGQFPFIVIGELQTFLRGSKNEKDVLRCIGNGEVYNYPLEDGKMLPISAWGVYACIADSNRYKKMLVDGDKELLRRFHRVYIELTDEKMKQRLDAIARQQMPTYGSASEKEADLDTIKAHIERTVQLEMPQKRFFNPFARFLIEYIRESCKDSGNMEEAAKIATYHKNYVLAGTKWNAKYRKYCKGNDFRYIAGIGDIYIAKALTDSDIGNSDKKPVDWHACWESGIESLKASGYPAEIISAYQKRHVSDDNKIYLLDPITSEKVLLADLSKPKPSNIIVTTEKYEKQPEEQALEAKIEEAIPVEPEILDAEYKIIESGEYPVARINRAYCAPTVAEHHTEEIDAEYRAIGSEERKALPCEKPQLPVLVSKNHMLPVGPSAEEDNSSHSRKGLQFTERKYITCKND